MDKHTLGLIILVISLVVLIAGRLFRRKLLKDLDKSIAEAESKNDDQSAN